MKRFHPAMHYLFGLELGQLVFASIWALRQLENLVVEVHAFEGSDYGIYGQLRPVRCRA